MDKGDKVLYKGKVYTYIGGSSLNRERCYILPIEYSMEGSMERWIYVHRKDLSLYIGSNNKGNVHLLDKEY